MEGQIGGANALTDDEMETLIRETEKSFSDTEAPQAVGDDISEIPGRYLTCMLQGLQGR